MSGRVEGKVAIVICAARGIGRAIAERLLEIKADLGLEPHGTTACRMRHRSLAASE
jgi:NAD(P)-dependent dehydrogenase (short-subunit alcohol dehydrogenase family)